MKLNRLGTLTATLAAILAPCLIHSAREPMQPSRIYSPAPVPTPAPAAWVPPAEHQLPRYVSPGTTGHSMAAQDESSPFTITNATDQTVFFRVKRLPRGTREQVLRQQSTGQFAGTTAKEHGEISLRLDPGQTSGPINRYRYDAMSISFWRDSNFSSRLCRGKIEEPAFWGGTYAITLLQDGANKYILRVERNFEGLECPICLQNVTNNQGVIVFKCGHKMHADCGLKSLKTNSMCPICREEIAKSADWDQTQQSNDYKLWGPEWRGFRTEEDAPPLK